MRVTRANITKEVVLYLLLLCVYISDTTTMVVEVSLTRLL